MTTIDSEPDIPSATLNDAVITLVQLKDRLPLEEHDFIDQLKRRIERYRDLKRPASKCA